MLAIKTVQKKQQQKKLLYLLKMLMPNEGKKKGKV